MKLKHRKQIDRCVRAYIYAANRADPDYVVSTPKDVVVTEIVRGNGWFTTMPYTAEIIREEVEKQLNFYTGRWKE